MFESAVSLFSGTNATNTALKALQDLQQHKPQTRFIRFQWQDSSGVLRGRICPIQYALQLATTEKNIRLAPSALHCIVDNDFAPWRDPRAILLLVADWSSLKIINENAPGPSYATVMCGVLASSPDDPIPSYNMCPRGALETVTRKASEKHGVDFLVGFEVEFEIVKIDESGNVVPASAGFGRYAIDGLNDPVFKHIEEAAQELLDAGVVIQEIHTEETVGQYEITLGPLPPLQAVDQLVFVHDTLKRVFARQGLIANMSPVTFAKEGQGTGQHTHVSINPPIKEEQFLAGILKRLPGLCAFTLPYQVSYPRLKPCCGGDAVAWGTHQRRAPIRRMNPGHWEIRCVDASANMYIALAAICGAGLLGYENDEPLIWPDTALDEHAAALDTAEKLPRTIDESLDALEGRVEDLQGMMESKIVRHYLELKRYEAERVRAMDPKDANAAFVRLF
ncbi:hypothetical protein ASPWEDRAFT_175841 [Aspergillus wentii DTO 134E9]|uniref:GS catalytic domain-containing protein n=1 Tax=Aspergillus wentii DTO 134E9 TaxID=1073089 RepID=A0A1L9RCB4_ASPWE|nr:uncharacterized protein ASPWEDRAFT_175841 [Aspergillus wentii DTO 134E9]KAI9935119.1 hypothetical protein MW887_000740 [Aspergillus wentii]OJJ32560.1 hypothetical protein ASPWEDRAFT_175841 [Aspergillus wentii DTO 134E9]